LILFFAGLLVGGANGVLFHGTAASKPAYRKKEV